MNIGKQNGDAWHSCGWAWHSPACQPFGKITLLCRLRQMQATRANDKSSLADPAWPSPRLHLEASEVTTSLTKPLLSWALASGRLWGSDSQKWEFFFFLQGHLLFQKYEVRIFRGVFNMISPYKQHQMTTTMAPMAPMAPMAFGF